MQPTTYYLAAARATPAATARFADGVGLYGLGAVLLGTLVWQRLHARRARHTARALADRGAPQPGPKVVSGRVVEDGQGAALTLALEQRGREWLLRGSWAHRWQEERRRLTVRAFYVACADGEQVRVEPDDQVLFVGELDVTRNLGPTCRLRRATLRPGDRVFVSGDLRRDVDPRTAGHRDARPGWVLRPPSSGRMVVSTEPPPDRHLRRAATCRTLAIALTALLLTSQAALFARFHLLRLDGREIEAAIVDEDSPPAHDALAGRFGWPAHHRLRAEWRDARVVHPLVDEISSRFAFDLQRGAHPRRAPFVVSRRWPGIHQIGHEPAENTVRSALMGVLVLLFGVGALAFVRSRRPWYERTRLVETGAGRL